MNDITDLTKRNVEEMLNIINHTCKMTLKSEDNYYLEGAIGQTKNLLKTLKEIKKAIK